MSFVALVKANDTQVLACRVSVEMREISARAMPTDHLQGEMQ
jgi:hypothetical protein